MRDLVTAAYYAVYTGFDLVVREALQLIGGIAVQSFDQLQNPSQSRILESPQAPANEIHNTRFCAFARIRKHNFSTRCL